MPYVKDRTVAFIYDESLYVAGVDAEDTEEQVSRDALRALNKRVGVRERIVLGDKPERIFRISMDAEENCHLHCVKR